MPEIKVTIPKIVCNYKIKPDRYKICQVLLFIYALIVFSTIV